jgi:hypothetical protein
MSPINISAKMLNCLAQTFGFAMGSVPFTYLGLPMGITKPSMEDLTLMMDKVERCLGSCLT